MDEAELTERVRALRANGSSPKEIAHALGVPRARVVPVVRQLAAQDETPIGDREVAGCWVSPGWQEGLTFEPRPDWPAGTSAEGTTGLVGVLVARALRRHRVSACGFLVDVYCLGVKNVIPAREMDQQALPMFVDAFFENFATGPLQVPLELAQHLVFGAVEYARGLGFPPHEEFAAAAGHLGSWTGPSPIGFGKDGVPVYVPGPHDDPDAAYRTLENAVGPGNFEFVARATG
ncbi:helix-turn-helix domain-containing protein [Amycolatopsis aidingensis]|uniref:helix-turn-helix domain-containing protein n=1 Tax=Amycolatopsis aidingensis TaxID=2842453 RepID=UPI001C0ACE91|nr:helix-turn-helix domain-containing protein [Amycolatopsis aidingensis]